MYRFVYLPYIHLKLFTCYIHIVHVYFLVFSICIYIYIQTYRCMFCSFSFSSWYICRCTIDIYIVIYIYIYLKHEVIYGVMVCMTVYLPLNCSSNYIYVEPCRIGHWKLQASKRLIDHWNFDMMSDHGCVFRQHMFSVAYYTANVIVSSFFLMFFFCISDFRAGYHIIGGFGQESMFPPFWGWICWSGED